MKYLMSKDRMLLAMIAMTEGKLQLAGKLFLRASQEPDFKEFADELHEQQQAALAASNKPKVEPQRTALASLIEGLADVNDMDDLLEQLSDDGEIEEPEEVAVDPAAAAPGVNVDVEDETLEAAAYVTAANERLQRAQRNLARRTAK